MSFIVIFMLESLRRVYYFMRNCGHRFRWPMMLCHVVFCVINYTAIILQIYAGNRVLSFYLYIGNDPNTLYSDLYWMTIGMISIQASNFLSRILIYFFFFRLSQVSEANNQRIETEESRQQMETYFLTESDVTLQERS